GKYNVDRLQRVALAAMKQSQRAFLPKIVVEDQWTELLQKLTNKNVFVAHCYSSQKKNWKEVIADTAHVFIGPEGDFSETEVQQLVEIGAMPISLGEARLRAETAGMLVVAQYYSR
ncbi:MAG: hypothetical protein RL362_722, partial [Bacteroidota bacterium]